MSVFETLSSLGQNLVSIPSKYEADFAFKQAEQCFDEVKANLDEPKWSSQSFVDCIPRLETATAKTGQDAHRYFLALLLNELNNRERLPGNLIRELILYYKWPSDVSTLEKNDIDPLIKEILQRYASALDGKQSDLVGAHYRKKVRRRKIIYFMFFLIAIVFFVFYKFYFIDLITEW